jgi:TorA maturation chaperone TorD
VLVGAARAQDDEAIAAEYDRLFGGVGKPEVFLYGSHYLSGFLNEKPLVRCAATWPRWAWRAAKPCPRPKTMWPICAK